MEFPELEFEWGSLFPQTLRSRLPAEWHLTLSAHLGSDGVAVLRKTTVLLLIVVPVLIEWTFVSAQFSMIL